MKILNTKNLEIYFGFFISKNKPKFGKYSYTYDCADITVYHLGPFWLEIDR